MFRQTVSSSTIAAIGHDPYRSLLEIEFHSGGIYQYSGVPTFLYDALMAAPSHGRFFAQNIKGRYGFRRAG